MMTKRIGLSEIFEKVLSDGPVEVPLATMRELPVEVDEE